MDRRSHSSLFLQNGRFAFILAAFFVFAGLTACSSTQAAAPIPTPTLDPVAAVGRTVFTSHCGSCHSTADDTVIVGPSLAGVAGRAGTRVDGLDARTYLYTSILQPGTYIVDGFAHEMPENFGKKLTGEEVDGLVAYLLTLQN